MKWKKDVNIDKTDGIVLKIGGRIKKISDEDMLIANLIENGITDDNALVAAVAKHDGNNEMTAGLQLAQFAADYAAFLEQAQGKRVFE
ncbi:MAG: hypothetical protein J6A07_05125 [Firmicutes bacterium]|nr:hypothetical protein [Bacillota bacterium]